MPARDNGLPQTSTWTRLADLDPLVADRLVELLGDVGVAAYAEASSEGPIPVPLATPVGRRPSDRVFVGQSDLDRARVVLLQHLPALRAEQDQARMRPSSGLPDGMDVETEFAGIIAGWDGPGDEVGRWSALEDLPAGSDLRPSTSPATEAPAQDSWGSSSSSPAAPLRPPPDDPQDHYVPPPPPPLPRGDRVSRAAWVGLVGGPVVLVLGTLTGNHLDGWIGLAAVLATLGGFATLVGRMKDRPNREDDPDDGAVV